MKRSIHLVLFLILGCGLHAEDVTLFSATEQGNYWYVRKREYDRRKGWNDRKQPLPLPMEKIISLSSEYARKNTSNPLLQLSNLSLQKRRVETDNWFYVLTFDQNPPIKETYAQLKTIYYVVMWPDGTIVEPQTKIPDDPDIRILLKSN